MRVLIAILAVALCAGAAQAQQAPLFLEPGHWAWDAVRRISAAGAAPLNADAAEVPVTLEHARAVFTHALENPATAELAHGYLARLEHEAGTSGALTLLRVRAGWMGSRGEARAGEGFFVDEDWVGAQPVSGSGGIAATVLAGGTWGRFGWQFHGGRLADRAEITAATVSAAVGPFDLWGGRRRLHFGAGRSGAVVLGAGINEPPDFADRTVDVLDGIGVYTRDAFEFPGFLRVLGPARIELAGGKLPYNGRAEDPLVVFGRLTGTPFGDRFMLGVNRGSIFGGMGQGTTPRRLLTMLLGGNSGEYENQVISAVMRYRPPVRGLPLEAYLEFGADDLAGGWKDVPGYIFGVDLGYVPGLPELAVGVEHTQFGESCCGNPPWYRHVYMRGSWSDHRGRLFAHPLGGNGSEWLLHSRYDSPVYGISARLDLFRRDRGPENLFAPEREGESLGLNATAEFWALSGLGLRADVTHEKGDAWRMSRAALLLSWRPPLPF